MRRVCVGRVKQEESTGFVEMKNVRCVRHKWKEILLEGYPPKESTIVFGSTKRQGSLSLLLLLLLVPLLKQC